MRANVHLLVAALSAVAVSCSAPVNPGTPPEVTVTLSPSSVELVGGAVQPFTATVTGAKDPSVSWSLSGVGALGADGRYTAPARVAAAGTAVVTATSNEDPTRSASATVTLVPVSVTVSPSTPELTLRAGLVFAARVLGTSDQRVTWSLGGPGCASGACGQLDADGGYLGPWCLPTPAGVTITATSVADPSASGSVSGTLTLGGPALVGDYVFAFEGSDGQGVLRAAGTFTLGADGGVTRGRQDVARLSGVSSNVPFTGSASFRCFRRGTLTFTEVPSRTTTYAFAFDDTGRRARFVELDASGGRGTGVAVRREAFPSAGLTGDVVLALSGAALPSNSPPRVAALARLPLDAHGRFDGGVMDVNFGGAMAVGAPVSGAATFDVDAGRGTVALVAGAPLSATLGFAFYPASEDEAFWVSTDIPSTTTALLGGRSSQRVGAPFGPDALAGTTLLRLSGKHASNQNAFAAVATLSVDAGTLSGRWDENDDTALRIDAPMTGTVTLDGDGRGVLRLSVGGAARELTVYVTGAGQALVLDGSPTAPGPLVGLGALEPRSPGPWTDGSLAGVYVLGTWGMATRFVPVMSGVAVLAGGRAASMVDASDIFGNHPDRGLFDAAFSLPASGQGSFGAWLFTAVSPTRAVLLDVDTNQHQPAITLIER